MKSTLFQRFVYLILLGLMLSTSVFADTVTLVTKTQADAAVSVLNITKRIKHFCPPCSKPEIRDEQYETAIALSANIENYWRVSINGKSIDLAYVYFPVTDGRWKNLAAQIGLRFDDIPEFLPGQINQNPYNPPPVNPGSTNGEIKWLPVVEMDKQIFPSFFLATATQNVVKSQVASVIGDAQGKIGMHIINQAPNTNLKIGIEVDKILKYQEFETNLREAGTYYQIYPPLVWNWDALKSFKNPSPANATFSLYLNGKLIEKKTVVVRVRSVNDAVFAYSYLLDENRWADTKWMFAAYVNEDHDLIDPILKLALDSRIIDSFSGYQTRDTKQVLLQAFSIWYVLQSRGIKYSSITNTSGTGTTTKVYSQYVRFLEESVNSSQANCVDGSVLIASVLKKIDIRVALVLIPGHCFLVFDVTGNGDWRGLETTMIGLTDLTKYTDARSRVDASLEAFLKAVDVGNQQLTKVLPAINQKDPRYNFVDINEARRSGVFPIVK